LSDEIKTIQLDEINDATKIVRYMKLETFLLMVKQGWAFIPSHATLKRSDPLETGILFNLPQQWTFLENWTQKIASSLERFQIARAKKERESWASLSGGTYSVEVYRGIRANLREYMDELAVQRCVWCWNKFQNYSNALWLLYGNRGVAIRSTIGKVKAALVEAGAVRGIVAQIVYIDHEAANVPEVLTKQENIFRPYLLKSIAFNYEKEIRFILAAQNEILRDKGGVLISIKAAEFIDDFKLSPHIQSEEQTVVKGIVSDLLSGTHAASKPPPLEPDWMKLYAQYSGTPFTTQDSLLNVFLDML
jgi:hypothetical protein